MSNYRRSYIPGGSWFFTGNLKNRRSHLLINGLAALREAIATVRKRKPFIVDAWVILPDHMHCIWTLPEGDSDDSGRWRDIKKRLPAPCMALISGSRAFGNILFATTMILFGTKTTAISIRSSMAGSVRCGTGHIRPFTEMSEEDVIPLTGRASVWISPPVSAGKRSDISVHCNAIIDQTGAAMPCKRGFNTESLSALTEALVPPF